MVAALSLLIVFAVSFFVVRLASVALRLTGLPEQSARFQAMSALTGTGYTTTEAEMIVNYPIRRKIITWLMFFGNLGIVSVLSTLMISLVRTDANVTAILTQLAWMISIILIFFTIMLNSTVDRIFCGLISFLLKKFTFLGRRHYQRLMQLGNQLSVGEHQFFAVESLSAETLKAKLEGFSILAVRRQSGLTERFTVNIDPINTGDSLILLGADSAHDALKPL